MHSIESDEPIVELRRPWEPPAVTKLPVGSETKSTGENRQGAGPDSALQEALPQPPAEPQSKLGFSFEMAFPLSARLGH